MDDEIAWSATRSGPLAKRAKARMEDASRRWKAETDPQRRFQVLLEYTALMAEWLHLTQEHLRELDDAPLTRPPEDPADARASMIG